MDDDELWEAYRQVVFQLLDTPLQTEHFTIITADYPHAKYIDEALRKHRELCLYQSLKRYGRPLRLYGSSRDFKHRELSFATPGLVLGEALKIAQDYSQNAIYEVKDDRLYLHPCLMKHKSKEALGSFSERIVNAQDGNGCEDIYI